MDSISKITQSLTTAEDMRNQTKLVMQPYANWEEYLTPAPLSIAILGELVFISSATDFSINKNPPKDGYKYIKYPDSFRACLMQVCNSGWSAFNKAHRSMDNIRLYTDTVLDHMKAAEKNLFQDDEKVEYNIVKIANNCLELSNATEIYFIKVINIIHELLEVCISSKQVNENEKEEIEKTLVETKKKEESSQAAIKCTEEKLNYLKEDLIQANISYEKALNSLPSAGAIFAMDLFDGIAQTITHLANGIIAKVKYAATSKFRDTKSQFRDEECDAVVFDEINTYSKSAEILKCAQNVQEKMNVRGKEDDIDWTNFYDQKNKSTKTDFEEQQFRRIYKDLEKISDCSVKKDAQLLCQKGIQICNQLAQYAPDGNCEKDQSEKIIVGVLDLIQSASGFNSKSKAETKTPTMCPKPRMMSKQEDKSERTSPGRKATENAQFTIEKNQAQLNQTRESYEKCVEKLERKQEELTEIQITIRQCELKKIELNTTIKMLVTGLDAMGRVKEQWEKMVHFFQMVSNIVKHFKTLTNFVSSEKTQFSKDLLYCQAFKALNIASLVHTISGTYTDVSKKYLIDPVGSQSKLMAMDKSKPEFELEYQKLQNCCDEAQRGILSLVLKNKEEFDKLNTAILEMIDQQLLAIPPPATPEQIKSIEEAVQDGFTDEEEASVTHPVARLVLWIFILLPVSCAMFVILFMLFC